MFDIIINPTSGKTKAKRTLKQVKKLLDKNNVQYVVHQTQYLGHAVEIAKSLTSCGNCNLVVVGGDGTFNEVLNGIQCFDNVNVGLIPCGTGNDFVRAIKIPTNVKKAVEIVLDGHVETVDFIQVGNKRALNCAGAGMDVDTLEKYSKMKGCEGKIKYYLAFFSVLSKLYFHKVRVTLDDNQFDTSIFMAGVCNGTSIGGGIPVSPASNVQDGLLDLVVINQLPPKKIPKMLIKFLKGKHLSEPFVQHFLTKQVRLEVLDDGKTEIDGEIQQTKVLDCKVISNKLRLYCKGDSK